MEPLPKLLAALERNGNSDDIVVMTWKSVMAGAKQPQIKTVEHYRAAWIACTTAADILTTLEDGSEAATWFGGLSQRIFEFDNDWLTTISELVRSHIASTTFDFTAPVPIRGRSLKGHANGQSLSIHYLGSPRRA